MAKRRRARRSYERKADQPVEEGHHPDLDWLDWKDPVTQLDRLQTAVSALAEGSGPWSKRMDKATYALIFLRSEDFPKRLRMRATKVLSIRGKVTESYVGVSYFHFEKLTPGERKRLVADIIALYEACLIDIGRTWPRCDFVYPEDVDPPLETK
jgi:hypothetical protein